MDDQMMTALGLKFSARYRWSEQAEFSDHLFSEVARLNKMGWADEWDRSELVYRFLVRWRAQCRLDESLPTTAVQDRLVPLFKLIEERLDDPAFGVDQMADAIHVSPRHLSDLFRKNCRTSPYRYLLQLRLSRARLILLNEPSTGIKETAHRVGFRDPSHFIQVFRTALGMSPDHYRKATAGAV